MTHSNENVGKYSEHGLPVSEHHFLQVAKSFQNTLDWTSSRQKSKKDKLDLANAKKLHKQHSKNPYFKEYRNEFIKALIQRTPNWGSVKFTLIAP